MHIDIESRYTVVNLYCLDEPSSLTAEVGRWTHGLSEAGMQVIISGLLFHTPPLDPNALKVPAMSSSSTILISIWQ